MRNVVMHIRAEGVQPDAAYLRVSDFARYPELTDTVLAVDVEPVRQEASVISTWRVRFRKGQLRWTERDVLDPVGRRIEFAQLSGDFASFEGHWQVDPTDDGTGVVIVFDAWFDLGIPTLADILDPVAESTLRSNIMLILTGLLGPVTQASPVVHGV